MFDAASVRIAGATVAWSISGVGSFVGTPDATTNVNGEARATITSAVEGMSMVNATVSHAGMFDFDTAKKVWTPPPLKLQVSKFFTDTSTPPKPLPVDAQGNPKVDVVIANGKVRSTNPGQIMGWVKITNTGLVPVTSVSITDTLPKDWNAHPAWDPSRGAIHIYRQPAGATGFSSLTEIAWNASTVNITSTPGTTGPTPGTGTPGVVMVALNVAAVSGNPLNRGESIMISIKLDYALKGTTQSGYRSYPFTYVNTAQIVATADHYLRWTGTFSASASFKAYAK